MSKIDKDIELDQLQAEHALLTNNLKELATYMNDIGQIQRFTKLRLKHIGSRIADLKKQNETLVTDHAVIRYLARYTDFDLDEVHKKIEELPDNEKVIEYGNVLTVGKNLAQRSKDD